MSEQAWYERENRLRRDAASADPARVVYDVPASAYKPTRVPLVLPSESQDRLAAVIEALIAEAASASVEATREAPGSVGERYMLGVRDGVRYAVRCVRALVTS